LFSARRIDLAAHEAGILRASTCPEPDFENFSHMGLLSLFACGTQRCILLQSLADKAFGERQLELENRDLRIRLGPFRRHLKPCIRNN